MVTKEDILRIAKLSGLLVKDEELDGLTADMSGIIGFADEISKAGAFDNDFDNINGLSNVFREDLVEPSFSRELILKNADGGKDGFFCIKNFK